MENKPNTTYAYEIYTGHASILVSRPVSFEVLVVVRRAEGFRDLPSPASTRAVRRDTPTGQRDNTDL